MYLFQALLSLRYKVKVVGLDKIVKESSSCKEGILFLPNHPTVFVDPLVIGLQLLKKFSAVRPMVVEYFYRQPFMHVFLRFINAVPVPDMDSGSNSYKRSRTHAVIGLVKEELHKGENFLIYPAGRTKSTQYEAIGGASAVHEIVSNCPEARVVLVRIKGLWGSMFSRAFTGTAPLVAPNVIKGFKYILSNFIFFTPRREVIVEFVDVTEKIPRSVSKLEFNRWLEQWYNQPDGLTKQEGELPGDSLLLIPHTIWSQKTDALWVPPKPLSAEIDLTTLSPEVCETVIEKIAAIASLPKEQIKPSDYFSADLAMDSLDTAELALFIQDEFEVDNVSGPELKTVADALAIADRKVALYDKNPDKTMVSQKMWKNCRKKQRISLASGQTIPEVFLNNAKRFGSTSACTDERSGVVSYKEFVIRTLILADVIRKLPGKYIGILLPSSVTASMCVLAVQLSGKVPLLINWTVGSRHLEAVEKLSKVEVVLTSWAFLDRLEHVDLTPIESKFFMLEDLRDKVSLFDKLKAFGRSLLPTRSIMKIYGSSNIKDEDEAVLLFTSGTESLPKGVPLTHGNILTNHKDALQVIDLFTTDVFLAILPPFHAFGFTVSTLLPLLSGIPVIFHPNPTDGRRLANLCKEWKVSVLCGAPTFLKAIFRGGDAECFKHISWCITGAEKAPPELFATVKNLGIGDAIYEGYGITECSPVLTINRPGTTQNGVGEPLPSVELKIVHPETYASLEQGETGLVLARGPNIFKGYLNPDIASPFVSLENKKWYKTGDLGFLDEKGKLVISGRQKRFIKVGGEMLSLGAIETAILESAPEKGWPIPEDGACVAVCAKEKLGEKPKVVLFTTFHTTVDETNQILRSKGFSNLSKISEVIELKEIPLMGTGKVYYRQLESQYVL